MTTIVYLGESKGGSAKTTTAQLAGGLDIELEERYEKTQRTAPQAAREENESLHRVVSLPAVNMLDKRL